MLSLVRSCKRLNERLFVTTQWNQFKAQRLQYSNDHDNERIEKGNDAIKPMENFVNRNPRNLERLCYTIKDYGWGMEWGGYAKILSSNFPRRNYYHRLILRHSSWHMYAEVEHHTGRIVIDASTREKYIRKRLHCTTDVSAAANLGRVIASRCLRAGISCVSFRFPELYEIESESINLFKEAAEAEGLCLEEPSYRRLGYVKPHELPTGPSPPGVE
ncbi:large ribosomal subunit protein uL18m-like [Styela clava]